MLMKLSFCKGIIAQLFAGKPVQNLLRHILLILRDPLGIIKQKKREKMANQYDDVAFAAEKRPFLQFSKYKECTQQVMPFTYTSQHSKVRKIYLKNQT